MNIKLSTEIPFNILQLRDNESEATQKEIYRILINFTKLIDSYKGRCLII